MKSFLLVLVALIAASMSSLRATESFDHEHKLWTELLAAHVAPAGFDYAALDKDRAKLDAYLAQLRAVTPAELAAWTREQRYAFWVNAYNANCVALVLTEYPIDSIKDLGGWFSPVWKKSFIDMPSLHPSGKARKLSLDDIEHAILRPQFKDARVHAAINCASVSCPPLRNEAFVPARLDQQLDDSARKWLADPTRNRFDRTAARAELSEIFKWFEDDFTREGGLQAWIAKFAPAEHAQWLSTASKLDVRYLDYSWKLNDVAKAK